MRYLLASSVCWLAVVTSGCSGMLDLPEEAELVAQGPWRCLGDLEAAPAPAATVASVQVAACDFISNCTAPVTGLTARVCAKRDVGCTNPLRTDIADRAGLLQFDVSTAGGGFDGYLEVTAPTASCTDTQVFGEAGASLCELAPGCDPAAPDQRCLVPTHARSMLFFNPPIVASVTKPLQLPMMSSAGLPALVQAAGAELDPTTGNLFITAIDCDGAPAAGVTYAITQSQDKVTQLYVDSGVVSDTALQTDSSGVGGFVGVPAGFAEAVGYNADLERIGEVGVQSAPFTMTYVALVPSL